MSDPLHDLQAAARRYAKHVLPGVAARSLVIRDEHREPIAQVRIPACAGGEAEVAVPEVRPGWDFSRKVPRLDGVDCPEIMGRNLSLLRLLAEADGPLGVDALRAAWLDYKPEEKTVRNQVGELRKVLRKLWPDWAEPIAAAGNGYTLEIR